MSIGALDSAISGLRAAQAQLDVISTNVSNASTPGYTRKILPQSALVDSTGAALGVTTNIETRSVDIDLEKEFWTQTAQVSYLNTQATYLGKIQTFNGTPDSDTTVAAQISALQDSFNTLSDDPSSTADQAAVVNAAQTVATKLNDFSSTLTNLRNTTQTDLTATVADANTQLQAIAKLNSQIAFNQAGGQSTADLQDSRDQAVQALSQDMNVTTFTRGDGVMVVQTTNGVQLADTTAQTLTFSPVALSASSGAGASIYVGDPTKQANAINISSSTASSSPVELGGQMGALVDLRDTTLPAQQASLDEMAEQLATRTNAQGLKLFTDANGNIPSNAAANTSTTPPTPVPYTGFAATIQVNQAVVDNNALVQQGTVATDDPVQSGSDEVTRRIADFAFGTTAYQQVNGTTNLNTTGSTDLQTLLGLQSQNTVTGTKDLSTGDLTSVMANDPTTFHPTDTPPTDQFSLTFGESRTTPPLGPTTVTVSLSTAASDFPIDGNTIKSSSDQLAAEINKQITAAGVPAGLDASASVNSYGELSLNSTGNITVDASGTNGMGATGLQDLGLTAGTQVTTDPYFTVQVGDATPVTITIAPGDTAATLVDKLDKSGSTDTTGVDGLGVSLNATTGFLTLRPGDSVTNPTFGGDLTITGGPFTADGTGTITGGMASGTTIIKALFGSDSPVTTVANTAIRSTNLGAGANLSTGVTSNGSITDYAQQVINSQAEQYSDLQSNQSDASTYATTLQTNLTNGSGVNIDEEMSNMIVVQTAYSAAARLISAVQDEFKDLISAFDD